MEDNHQLSFLNHNNIIDYYICTLIGYNPTKIFFKLKFKTFFYSSPFTYNPTSCKAYYKSLLCLSKCHYYYYYEKKINDLAPVVQTVDNAIHRINHYPLNIAIGITYPVDSAIHCLNNWGLVIVYIFCYINFKCTYQNYL